MKPAAYLLTVLLLSVCALAQDSVKPPPPKEQLSSVPSGGLRFPLNDEEQGTLMTGRNTCYTMRTYFFHQSEDGTMEPAGMTTCVKSSQRALKRAQKNPAESKPEVRLFH